MFTKKVEKTMQQELLEREIERTMSVMRMTTHESKEYASMLHAAERLYEMLEKQKKTPDRVSRDVRASIAANLAGIVLILSHERVNVITTKALGFVHKTKVV